MNTIVAPATPIGRGAIAVIRLSGGSSVDILRRLTPDCDNVKVRVASLVKISDPITGELLDEALVTYFQAPHSVTGEDVVELSCHGSPTLVRTILDLTLQLGARLAEPGEFTLRALSNGKINLTQAEAIRDLITARTSTAVRQAARQVGGELSAALDPFKNELIRVIVLFESALEFVEDDLPATELEVVTSSLRLVEDGLTGLANSFAVGRLVKDGIRVAIVGSPNVGKSSLFNRLVEQDRAIVTDIPGTTRDTLTESIEVGGIPVVLTDTAGLRETSDSIESLGIERSRRAISDADVILSVVDATGPDGPSLVESETPQLLVFNKSDLVAANELKTGINEINVSALTGQGLDELRAGILKCLNQNGGQPEGLLITNARHHDLLKASIVEIQAARGLVTQRTGEELIVVPLHNALKYLGQITGETTTEDILGEIFSTFCIGK